MEIKILYKEYPRNLDHEVNHVCFTLDGKEFKLPIIYIKQLKRNVFLSDAALTEFEKYVEKNYNNNVETVKNYFLYCLYNYSKGRGLEPTNYLGLKKIKYKEN